jgi:phosphoglycolate phosphatase
MFPMRLLFDLDGTLLDTAPDLHNTLNHCLISAGREAVTLESVKHMVGQGARVLLERGLTATGGMLEETEIQELMDLFFSFYGEHLSDHSVAYPGMIASLEKLQADGCIMGICTNKPVGFAKTISTDFNLDRFFPVITGGDSFEIRKPHPGHIEKSLDLLGNTDLPTVMIGDTHNDIDAANAADISSIAVSFGYGDQAASDLGATAIIDHFDELYETLSEVVSRQEKAAGS